jgi:hypothetical protein
MCAVEPSSDHIKGWSMVFTLPSSLTVHSSNDVDYQMRWICYKPKPCMRFGWGGTWSGPTLSTQMLEGLRDVRKRVVLGPYFIPIGIEYRALREDGTHFRTVTKRYESIAYDHADNETTMVFNQTVDSLCLAKQ